MSSSLPRGLVLLCAVVAGFLTMVPYLEHLASPQFEGLTIGRDKDYQNYESRLERAVLGYPSEAANAITPVGSGIEGMQVAGMEEVLGVSFSWTHLGGPTLAVIITCFSTIILFLLFFILFRVISFPATWSLGITLVLFMVMFHGLSRIVQPGWTFVPAIASLILFFAFWKKQTVPRLLGAAVLLATLPYLYFWHWTFVWAVCGSLAVLSLFSREWNVVKKSPWQIALLGVITLLLSVPFFLDTVALFHNPLYAQVAVRASFLYQRTPESWTRSILLIIDLIAFLSLFKKYKHDVSYLFCGAMLLGLTLAMHQNVFHDRVLMFASHFEPHLIIVTLITAAWVVWKKAPRISRAVVVILGLTFLCAGAYDYAFANDFFFPTAATYSDQHLAGAIADLQKEGNQTILTDSDTGRIITSWTADGIIYTTHARFLLISDADLAERYCVSEMFNPHPLPARVLSIEYNRVLQSPEYQAYEQKLLSDACTRVQKDRVFYLKKYAVTMVLWNKDNRPDWSVDPKAMGLSEVRSGSGWVLWQIEN